MKFVGIVRISFSKKVSGRTHQDYINDAMGIYEMKYKKSFAFLDCLELLHNSPKFMRPGAMVASAPADAGTSEISTPPRPIGRKRAKEDEKNQESITKKMKLTGEYIAETRKRNEILEKQQTEAWTSNLLQLMKVEIDELPESNREAFLMLKSLKFAELREKHQQQSSSYSASSSETFPSTSTFPRRSHFVSHGVDENGRELGILIENLDGKGLHQEDLLCEWKGCQSEFYESCPSCQKFFCSAHLCTPEEVCMRKTLE
tara:strand:- start:400 stop:1176 length:777 start_codon:yes stop_codon:yes gene_type:complete